MLPGKLLIIGVTVSALIVTGCSKKKDVSSSKLSQTSAGLTQSAPSKAAETDDIFNEFYKDENSNAQKEKLTSKETFTPSGASKGSLQAADQDNFSPNGRYVLQISTVVSQSFAERLKTKLNGAGYPAYVAEVQNPTPSLSGTYYRIRIGAFASIAAARSFAENNLKSAGYDYWIDNKANDNVGIDAGSFGNSGNTYYSTPNASLPPAPAPKPSNSDWGSSPSSTTPAPATNGSISSPASSSPAAPADEWAPGTTPAPSTTNATPATTKPAAEPSQTPVTSTPAATPSESTSTNKKDNNSGWGTSGW